MLRVVVILIVVALTVYALVEAAQAQPSRVRLMPRWLWMLAILCVPVAGPVGWLLYGRPRGRGLSGKRPPRPIAPDDDPDFLRRL